MKCPNCNSKVKKNAIYCPKCKYILSSRVQQIGSEDSVIIGTSTKDEYADLINSYIGKNAEKITKEGYSFYALFNLFYAFYRKMWGLGIFLWFLCFLIVFTKFYFMGYILFFSSIILMFVFNKLYVLNVRKRVIKIKNKHRDKANEELIKICSKKGGTSVISVFVGILLVFMLPAIYFYRPNEHIGNMSYKISDEFVLKESNGMQNEYFYDKDGEKCSIKIDITIIGFQWKYYSSEDYIKYEVSENLENVSKVNINNVEWYTIKKDKKDYYVTSYVDDESNGKIYAIKYEEMTNQNSACSENFNKFLNSIQFYETIFRK